MKGSWKTSTFGGIAAAAGALAGLPGIGDPIHTVALILACVCGALFAFYAKDKNVTGGDTANGLVLPTNVQETVDAAQAQPLIPQSPQTNIPE